MSSATQQATIHVGHAFRTGPVPPGIFGSFVEHMGRCVYGGIHEPGHPSDDGSGFRGDVTELVRELGVTLVRYPGGNFVSGYRWEDGIGPVEQRPRRLDRAWRAVESNAVGTDEFLGWTERVGVEPVLAVNLGTAGVQEACDLLEYVNRPAGTLWADRRVANGRLAPYGVRRWCLGNELDGPWQIGHKTADEYGRLAAETARAMRRIDPDLELVVCGSSNSSMPTFGSWEATVLDHCSDLVDYVSLHTYYEQHGDDRASFLASAADMDHVIESIAATADAVAAKRRSRRRLRLAFDEWNVWRQQHFGGESSLDFERTAPNLIEDDYSVADGVVVGSLLVSLLRHADRVHIACLAQLVNVIAPIRTEPAGPAWRQSSFWPFAATARHARGDVLHTVVDGPRHATDRYGDVDTVQAVATFDDADGAMTVIVVNRSPESACTVRLATSGFGPLGAPSVVQLWDADFDAVNTADTPDRVVLRERTDIRRVGATALELDVPATSWTMLRVDAELD